MPHLTTSGNAQNVATGKHVNTRSKFDLSYHAYDTFRFGELHPHFVMEGVPGDKISLRSAHNLRSLTLNTPLMSKIQLKKDYFVVPNMAILPLNWDLIYKNPKLGDDVPSDAGTFVADFTALIKTLLNTSGFKPSSLTSPTDLASAVSYWNTSLKWLLTAELFFSSGSLLNVLGCKLAYSFTGSLGGTSYKHNFDSFFDQCLVSFYQAFNGYKVLVEVNGDNWYFNMTSFLELRQMLDLMRDNLGTFEIKSFTGGTYTDKLTSFGYSITIPKDFGIDIARCLAYQIVCAHYYTNDNVDYIYSAELYRNYICSILTDLDSNGTIGLTSFSFNGTQLPYDYLASVYFIGILTNADVSDSVDSKCLFSYLQAIFGYKHSLRYVDYFVGARTRPLAIGDVNVDVQTGTPNYVSAVDVTRRIQAQRFFNAVNRAESKIEGYVKEIFGVDMAPDYHNPFYIGHTADDVYGQEVENTGVAQMTDSVAITSNLRGNGAKYEFSFDCDRPCIVLGITYFDISRSYISTIERQFFHENRFDMFNPFMQFIGDQEVKEPEYDLTSYDSTHPTFGYQLRHAEYKQRFNQASSGFIHSLPGWNFLYNDDYSYSGMNNEDHISPSFIRSKPWELDRFYKSLTGFSLGTYFHFIVDNYNDCKASRPMAFAPSIL